MSTVPTLTTDLWTIRDIAEALEVSKNLIGMWRHRGKMPEPDGRIGRTLVWRESTIRPWIAAQRDSGNHG